MDKKKSMLALFRVYLSKKQRLHYEIAKIGFECQRLMQKYRRNSHIRNYCIFLLMLLNENSIDVNDRLAWSYTKNDKWWTTVVPSMTDQNFKSNFRVEKSTFLSLIRQIGSYLEKANTNYRTSISIEKRIACALYALGSTSELRTIGNLFGIGKSTATEILHEFCSVMIDQFFHRMIKFPTTSQELEETTNGFFTKFGYPMCVGALDGTHIGIKPPLGLESDYYNYKKYHSVIMLATVNSNLEFTYINVGAPGRCNDSSVYSRSTLSQVIQHSLYKNHYITVNNVKIQSHLIADSAFSLDETLLKPFAETPNMTKQQSIYNYRLSKCRCSVERAFGSLKNRFRCLHKKMEFSLDNTINIIKTATILHNICIIEGDDLEVEWNLPEKIYKKPACNTQTNCGNYVRMAMMNFFLQNPL